MGPTRTLDVAVVAFPKQAIRPGMAGATIPNLTLVRRRGTFAVCQLNPSCPEHVSVAASLFTEAAKDHKIQTVFLSMCPTEISAIVGSDKLRRVHAATCAQNAVSVDDGWVCFVVEGSMAFNVLGVMAQLSSTLAEAGISLLAQSTYDTDYIFVKAEKANAAHEAFSEKGMTIKYP